MRTVLILLLGALSLAAVAEPIEAQAADSTELVFDREVFVYPAFERRNPFGQLVGANNGGPRFDALQLIGIIYSENADLSVALLSVGDVTSGDVDQNAGGAEGEAAAPAGQGANFESFRVRRGDVLGNTRILEIQRMRVIVEVTEFGIADRRVLSLPRASEGGE